MRRLAARIVLLDGWRRAGLAGLAGLVLTLGLPPFNLAFVGFVAFPLLVLLLDGAAGTPGRGFLGRLRPAFGLGWCFGLGYFVGGLWWTGVALTTEGDAFLWAIPFAVVGLPAVLAIYYGLAAALARAVWSDGPGRVFALAASFATIEVLRGWLLTGFPWNELGVLAAPVPLLMQSASLLGLHGLTILAVFVFAAPVLLLDRRPARGVLALALVLLLAHVGFGAWRLGTRTEGDVPGVAVRVVQPNIRQSEKWDAAEAERIFERLLTLTETRRPPPGAEPPRRTLVVWPESAFPFFLTERPDAIARLGDALVPGETLLAGAARIERGAGDAEPRITNAVLVIDESGEIADARDKVHLVPFGEYLPFEDVLKRIGLRQLAEGAPGGFSAGSDRRPVPLDGAPSFLPLICYEIIFQDEIAAGPGGAGRPGFVLNVTNDAWYGDTPGPYQHLRQAQLTALALGLPLVRAANTGISAVADAYGVLRDGLAFGAAGTIETALPAAAAPTPFARFGNLGFWLILALTWTTCCVYSVRNARAD